MILLCYSSDRCHTLDYQSCKSKCVVRSGLAGELFAFVEAFDAAFQVANDLRHAHGNAFGLLLCPHSLQVFDALTRSEGTDERCLMIDTLAASQSYKRFEITGVDYIHRANNPADGLTKANDNGS